MIVGRQWWLVGGASALVVAILAGAYLGIFGPLVTCGADGAAVCVGWPGVVSAAAWGAFVAYVVGLGAWQIWAWLRSADAIAPNEDV
jgi:hypothetical protein